jgi:oxygen-independent coproporphyrinogen-3 oxidase
MAAILTAIRRAFDVTNDAEITFEANPDSVSDPLLRRLRGEGFNRVSLGIQTDDDVLLQQLGRPHNFDDAVNAVHKIRKAGFKNLSVDLMYGLPGQRLEHWQDTLTNVLQLKPDHISCYGLKVEPGTPLYAQKDLCGLPDDDTQADMYLSAVELLKSRGYRHYEISNFAKKDKASAHNLKYWTGGEYLGFGPDASSDFAGKRFVMVRNLRAYIDGVRSGGQVIADIQEIPPRERAGEYLMMRLRTSIGINKEEYERQYLLPFGPLEDILMACKQRNHAILSDGRWRLSPEGMLLSNSILSDLLLAQDRTLSAAKRR